MTEWIRFWITAACLIAGTVVFMLEILGVYRFGFVMDRMHAAGMGDTLGLFLIVLGLWIAPGEAMDDVKLALIVVFMYLTSPTSTHFLSQIEYYTNPDLYRHVRRG